MSFAECVVLSLVAALCAITEDFGKNSIGYYTGLIGSMPFWVAEARGFYEEQGLDVELVAVLNPNQGTPAPVNGSITFVLNGFARENMNLSKC